MDVSSIAARRPRPWTAARVSALAAALAVALTVMLAFTHAPQGTPGAAAKDAAAVAEMTHHAGMPDAVGTTVGEVAAVAGPAVAGPGLVADCETCNANHSGAAVACAMLVALATFLMLPRLSYSSWAVTRPIDGLARVIRAPFVARVPDLDALSISRT